MQWSIRPFDYREDDEYKEALKYAQSFEPQEEVDYGWVFPYGEAFYDTLARRADALDEKADSIIKYLGAFSGLAALIGGYIANAGRWWEALSVLPMFALSLFAIWKAAQSRNPIIVPMPPPIKNAIEYAEAYGDKAMATFTPQLWAASAGMRAVTQVKAYLVRSASVGFFWAVVCLLIPLAVAMFRA